MADNNSINTSNLTTTMNIDRICKLQQSIVRSSFKELVVVLVWEITTNNAWYM